jgi:tripartite-type tricarboxylate transporter receptor subunit TctC
MAPNRRALLSGALALPLISASRRAWPQDGYPNRPIRVIVPFLAGGAADIVARIIAQGLSEQLGQPVYCDNRPGAGSNIGTELAAKATGDGYTLMVQGNPLGSNIVLFKNVGYDPIKSFVPIAMHYRDYNTLIVHPSFPANSVKELIAIAKKRPGELTYSSSGNGTSTHLAGEMFNQMAGVHIVHVPFRGVPPAVMAVMGQQTTMMFAGYGVVSEDVKSGRLKALAVTGPTRLKLAPDLPTVSEAGLPGFDATTWTGLFAPAGTPDAIVKRLNAAVNGLLERPDIRNNLEKRGFLVELMTPERVGQEVRKDMQQYGDVIRNTGAKVD